MPLAIRFPLIGATAGGFVETQGWRGGDGFAVDVETGRCGGGVAGVEGEGDGLA